MIQNHNVNDSMKQEKSVKIDFSKFKALVNKLYMLSGVDSFYIRPYEQQLFMQFPKNAKYAILLLDSLNFNVIEDKSFLFRYMPELMTSMKNEDEKKELKKYLISLPDKYPNVDFMKMLFYTT